MIEDITNQIEELTIQGVILILVAALILVFFLLTKTQKGREVRKKFRILPKLIPLDDDYETDIKETEDLDGSNRQLKGEIIDNEHDLLNQLLRQEGTEELSGFEDEDAVPAEEQDRNIPLANQNFNSMSGQIKSVSDEQEFCAECKKPVKAEWKACPFCGEFLEIYED
jgi:hypothetical protein